MPQKIFDLCQVEGCERKHKARGFCAAHYQHYQRGVEIVAEIKTRDRNPPEVCTELECNDPVKAKGLCATHYARLLRHGHTRYRDRKSVPKPCSVEGCDSHVYAKMLCHHHYQRRKVAAKKFGISPAQLDAMTAEQNGSCAICKSSEVKLNWRSNRPVFLSIDHCHKTGAVRGLLCDTCSNALCVTFV